MADLALMALTAIFIFLLMILGLRHRFAPQEARPMDNAHSPYYECFCGAADRLDICGICAMCGLTEPQSRRAWHRREVAAADEIGTWRPYWDRDGELWKLALIFKPAPGSTGDRGDSVEVA